MAVGRRSWAPPVASASVALLAAGWLAWTNAPRPDEFHTLSHVTEPTLGAMWRSFRSAADGSPALGYVWSWAWARVLGTGLIAVRLPYVACWGIAAAALSVLTRRAGPWAAFAAGIVPTATSLVYLGAYARGYAPVLAASAIALVCWDRLAEGAGRATAVALGCSCALAVGFHQLAGLLGVLTAMVAWAVPGEGRGRPGRVVAPLVGVVVATALNGIVLARSFEVQRTMARSVRPLDAIAFWPSAIAPAWPVLVPIGLLVLASAVHRWRGPEPTTGSDEAGSGLGRDLIVLGSLAVVAVPVLAVAAMAATSGVYFHRYALPAIVGASILVAAALDPTGRPTAGRGWRGAPSVVGLLLVGACLLATVGSARSTVGEDRAERLAADLGLADAGGPVRFSGEYDYLLVRRTADPALAARLGLLALPDGSSSVPGVVGSPSRVAWDRGLAPGGSVDLVGSPEELAFVDRLAAEPGRRLRVTRSAVARFRRPGTDRRLVRIHVAWVR